jgi:hypothetical protein
VPAVNHSQDAGELQSSAGSQQGKVCDSMVTQTVIQFSIDLPLGVCAMALVGVSGLKEEKSV